MKGSKKQFARYLKSEYDDEYIEPLDNKNSLNLARISRRLQKYTPDRINGLKTTHDIPFRSSKLHLDISVQTNAKASAYDIFSSSLKPQRDVPNIGLKIDRIEGLVQKLGRDAQDCASRLIETEHLQNKTVLSAFRSLHQKFETIPILFLSVVPNKGVYVWQINRLCPVIQEFGSKDLKERVLIRDSRNLDKEVVMHISFLLLGKIVPEEDEEFIGAQFVEDEQLCVRSKNGDNELIMRFYSLADFSETAIVNPFNEKMVANTQHFLEVRMKPIQGENGASEDLEVSIKRKNEEIKKDQSGSEFKMVQKCVYGNLLKPFTVNNNSFTEIYKGLTGTIVMLDEATSTVVVFNDADISISRHNLSFFDFLVQVDDSLMIKKGGIFHRIDFNIFPKILIENLGSNLEAEMMNKLELSKEKRFMKYQQKSYIMTIKNCYIPSHFDMLVYNNDISVRSRFQSEALLKSERKSGEEKIMEESGEDEGEEKETLSQRINKMKKRFEVNGNQRSEIKEKKELLREIRADIGKGMREVAKYEEEYRENEKNDVYYYYLVQKKELMEPSGVSKESLRLYEKIKEEKKKLDKMREKEKNQMKKDRLYKAEDHQA